MRNIAVRGFGDGQPNVESSRAAAAWIVHNRCLIDRFWRPARRASSVCRFRHRCRALGGDTGLGTPIAARLGGSVPRLRAVWWARNAVPCCFGLLQDRAQNERLSDSLLTRESSPLLINEVDGSTEALRTPSTALDIANHLSPSQLQTQAETVNQTRILDHRVGLVPRESVV